MKVSLNFSDSVLRNFIDANSYENTQTCIFFEPLMGIGRYIVSGYPCTYRLSEFLSLDISSASLYIMFLIILPNVCLL